MNRKDEEQMAAVLAKAMAMICVRNTMLEDLHAGKVPVMRTGDFSDVFVVDAEGKHIPWTEVSRFDDDEMRDLEAAVSGSQPEASLPLLSVLQLPPCPR